MDSIVNKALPHSDEAEIAVLGAILREPACLVEVIDELTPEHFYNSMRKHIYETMLELEMEGVEISLVTVKDEVKDDVGLSDLVDLQESVFTSAKILSDANILKEKCFARRIITNAHKAVKDVYAGEDVQEIMDRLSGTALDSVQKDATWASILHESFDEIDARREGRVSLIKSGIYKLDDILGGFAPGKLIVIGGRTSQGKTALMCQIALNAVSRLKKGVALFELEMTSTELACRFVAMEARVNLYKYMTGGLSAEEYSEVSKVMSSMPSMPLHIFDRPRVSLEYVRAKAKRLKARYDIGLICVDYLQLMLMPRAERHDLSVGVITGGLKSLAKELSIPVVLLSQLSRDETKTNRRPTLSDLRNSGCIEQDADVVIFTWLPDVVNGANKATLIVAKHRNGPTGEIDLKFNRQQVVFE